MIAREVCVASITASASAANSLSAYASGCAGRSERPLPRPSNRSTWQCRARYGICIFQMREWTTDQVGRSKIVCSPSPYRSQKTRTPSRSTKPSSSG